MTTTQLNSFLNSGLIELSAEDVAAAEKEAASQHVRLKDALVRLGLIREETLLQQAAEHLGLAYTELADDGIEAAAVQAVPAGTANHYHIMPFAAENLARVRVKMGRRDQPTLDLIERCLANETRPEWITWLQRERNAIQRRPPRTDGPSAPGPPTTMPARPTPPSSTATQPAESPAN